MNLIQNQKPYKPNSNLPNKVCPFIGTRDDSSTFFSYPSPGNHCFRVEPHQSITLSHQENFCLDTNFKTCPVNTSTWQGPLPQEIQGQPTSILFFSSYRRIFIVSSIVVLLFVLSIYILYIQNIYPFNPVSISTASPTLQVASDIPTLTAIESGTGEDQGAAIFTETPAGISPSTTSTEKPPTPSQTVTNTPVPTDTTTPTSIFPTAGPVLETPFGPDNRFVIHAVKDGEFFGRIAENFDTSVDLIIAANDLIEGANLWVGTLLVIIPGELDANDIPKFQIVFVDSQTTINDLSEKYSISTDELIFYNSLGTLEEIPAGRWIIFPISNN